MNNPFTEDVDTCELNLCKIESLLEICCDSSLLCCSDI